MPRKPAAKTAKTAKTARNSKASKAAKLKVAIDYPRSGETIRPGHYSFRLSVAPTASHVEVSVDQGPWSPCRGAAGFWWFDWTDFAEGAHRLEARAVDGESAPAVSRPRRFDVSAV